MTETVEVQRYLDRPLDDLMDELEIYHEHARDGMGYYADVWRRLEPTLRERVCVEWNWCKRRKDARTDEPLTIATRLLSIVAPVAMQWQVPAALIAVILVKRGLDAFCNCPPIAKA
jgi:hypothetical protein